MAKALIVTLGTGPGVESGIGRSIQVNSPEKLCFIASQESLGTIGRVEEVLGQKLNYEICQLEHPEDVEECWRVTKQLIGSLLQVGYHLEEICVDFTSGTKAMSAGGVLAGVSLECGSLSYVGSGRRDPYGRVISGTERVINLTPNEIFIDQRRLLIRDFFNAFQYEACLKLIEEAQTKIMAQEIREELTQLENLVYAYSLWDKFDHQGAASYFQRLLKEFNAQWNIDTNQSKEMVFKIARQRGKYSSTGKIEDKYSEEILADLLANAEHRAQEGKYDDAVARLYRAVEVIAQMLLAQRSIDTSKVEIKDLPADWQENYRGRKEPVKLGQENAFALLESLGNEIGKEYRENKNLRNYLSKRNSSILAHELEPMTKEIYDELSREVNQLAAKVFPKLSSLKNKSKFPLLSYPK